MTRRYGVSSFPLPFLQSRVKLNPGDNAPSTFRTCSVTGWLRGIFFPNFLPMSVVVGCSLSFLVFCGSPLRRILALLSKFLPWTMRCFPWIKALVICGPLLSAAACSTVNGWPAMSTVPARGEVAVFADTEYSTVPLPLPLLPEVSVIQSS